MKTEIGYKLFRKNVKTGKVYPLFVSRNEETPVGTWIEAKAGEMTANGKVKSSLGGLAYRGGWHLNEEAPYVEHIYSKLYNPDGAEFDENGNFDRVHKHEKGWEFVWFEIEYETTIDCQPLADANGWKNGKFNPRLAQLEMVDKHGYYRYKTNPNMFGTWIIAGNIKLVRELSRQEVVDKCKEYGLNALPTVEEHMAGRRWK